MTSCSFWVAPSRMIEETALLEIRISLTAMRPAAVGALEEELSEDAAERVGQHGAGLRLLVGREDVDHAVDGFAGVIGVQGAEDEQAGLGCGQGERDGLEVAHFADEDDVAILAQGGFQARRESGGMLRHFALGDDASFVDVHELDRFLDRNDVPRVVGVNVIDQRGQRSRLSGAGWAGDEDEPAAQVAKFLDDGRNAELFERGDAGGNEAEDSTVAVGLLEEIAAEARFLVHLVGEIEIATFFKSSPTC